jgi:hypothetical protein
MGGIENLSFVKRAGGFFLVFEPGSGIAPELEQNSVRGALKRTMFYFMGELETSFFRRQSP